MPDSLFDLLVNKAASYPLDDDKLNANASSHPLPPNLARSGFEGGMDFLKGMVWPDMDNPNAPMAERLGALSAAGIPLLKGKSSFSKWSKIEGSLPSVWEKLSESAPDLLVDDPKTKEEVLYNHLMKFVPSEVTPVPEKVTGKYVPPRQKLVAPEGMEFHKYYRPDGAYDPRATGSIELTRNPAIDKKYVEQQTMKSRHEAIIRQDRGVNTYNSTTTPEDLKFTKPTTAVAPEKKLTIREARAKQGLSGEGSSVSKGARNAKYNNDAVEQIMKRYSDWKGTDKAFYDKEGLKYGTFVGIAERWNRMQGRQ